MLVINATLFHFGVGQKPCSGTVPRASASGASRLADGRRSESPLADARYRPGQPTLHANENRSSFCCVAVVGGPLDTTRAAQNQTQPKATAPARVERFDILVREIHPYDNQTAPLTLSSGHQVNVSRNHWPELRKVLQW